MHTVLPNDSNRFTVVVFFMAGCRHLEVHDARLRQLAEQYRPRGVGFFAVDSEMHGSMDVDRAEVVRHGYPFAILRDVGGRVARALDAHHAGYAVVLDVHGTVRYRGAIDSDRFQLHEDVRPYLADALKDLLAGIEPRRRESESFGCALDP
jgi:hypothetical protein